LKEQFGASPFSDQVAVDALLEETRKREASLPERCRTGDVDGFSIFDRPESYTLGPVRVYPSSSSQDKIILRVLQMLYTMHHARPCVTCWLKSELGLRCKENGTGEVCDVVGAGDNGQLQDSEVSSSVLHELPVTVAAGCSAPDSPPDVGECNGNAKEENRAARIE